MERLVLVISVLIGNPPDWVEFRVPMETQRDCHTMLLLKHKTPEKSLDVRFHCDIKRDNERK